MRELIQHQVLKVAQAMYSGRDMYTEYTYMYLFTEAQFISWLAAKAPYLYSA